jgi:hypothetical protein
MEPKTQTTTGKLKIGDRFYFASDSKKEVYQLINQTDKSAFYNKINKAGNRGWQWDREATKERLVIFLRSTIETS